jgi:hypothetical protein
MDTNTVSMVLVLVIVSVFVFIVLMRGRKRKKEISLRDLFRTSKIKKLEIAKSKEKIKREKEEFIQYEANKKIDNDDGGDSLIEELEFMDYNGVEEVIASEPSGYYDDIREDVEENIIPDADRIEKLLEDTRTSGYRFTDKNIDVIDGIGSSYKKRLGKIGISSISDFVSASRDAEGLRKINLETGIYSKLLEKWIVKADMLRFQGISNEQIDKLIQIGITSSNQLAKASPVVLRDRLLENNSYSETPTLNMIKRWVRIAKELEIIDDLSLRS